MQLDKAFFEVLRTRLENILRPLSLNYKAHVELGDMACTDIEDTVILPAQDQIIPNIPASLTELYLSYKAMTAHEGAHIRFTSLKAWEEATSRGTLFQHLTNIIEDGRVEALISEELPGAGKWLRFNNEYFYKNKDFSNADIDESMAFLIGLTFYSTCQKIPSGLPTNVVSTIKKAAPYVDLGKAASCTEDVLPQVEAILALPEVNDLIDNIVLPELPDTGTDAPEERSSEKAQERAEKAITIIELRNDDEGSTEDEATEENTPENKDNNAEQNETTDSSSDNDAENNASKNSKDEKENDSKDEASNNKPSSKNLSDDVDNAEEESSSDEASNNDPPSENNKESSAEDSLSSSDDTDDAEEDFSFDEDTGNDTADNNKENISEDEASDINDPSLEDSFDSSDDIEEDAPTNNTLNTDGDTINSVEGSSANIEEEFFEEPEAESFDDLLSTADEELSTLATEIKNMEDEQQKQNADPVEKSRNECHANVGFREITPPSVQWYYDTMIKKNQTTIKNLIQEIEVALETRKAYNQRNTRRGRIDSSKLWKLAVPDSTIFSRRIIPGDIPELAISVLVDCSGSMSDEIKGTYTRMDAVKDAACVLSETCKTLKIKHTVTGFNDSGITNHYPAVCWDDDDSSRIAGLISNNCNRDGFSIRIVANELSLRAEPRKLLLVLSDGQPNADYYEGELAWQDTREAVLECKKMGIQVISLFFGDSALINNFIFMYDTPVFVEDLSTLPRILGEVFKKVLLEY